MYILENVFPPTIERVGDNPSKQKCFDGIS
jgi:hypothetical protein